MGKAPLLKSEVKKIRALRETGHSLNEIKNVVNRGYGTVFRYIKDVPILPEYQEAWKIKRGGSKAKSLKEWQVARIQASRTLNSFGLKEKMIILSCLYWGEGSKAELNLINSDPYLIRVVLSCLRDLGISSKEIKVGLRLFNNIDKTKAVNFWSKLLNIPKGSIAFFEIIQGKKTGKLEYGMCRIRVKKSRKHFKFIMSMIDLIRYTVK